MPLRTLSRGSVRLTDDQRAAATAMMAEHGPGLWRIALVVAGSAQAAEDLLATALLRTLPHLGRIDAPLPLYLRRVMLNLRASEYRRSTVVRIDTGAAVPDRPLPDDTAETISLRADIAAALEQLAPKQRAVLVLRYLEDRPTSEIARVLGCSEETVRSQSHRGLAKLRAIAPGLLTGEPTATGSTA
jgi:RNA polymerase sigma-70 factor (sigma-E family)